MRACGSDEKYREFILALWIVRYASYLRFPPAPCLMEYLKGHFPNQRVTLFSTTLLATLLRLILLRLIFVHVSDVPYIQRAVQLNSSPAPMPARFKASNRLFSPPTQCGGSSHRLFDSSHKAGHLDRRFFLGEKPKGTQCRRASRLFHHNYNYTSTTTETSFTSKPTFNTFFSYSYALLRLAV